MTSLNWLDRKTALFSAAIYLGISALVLLMYREHGSPDMHISSKDEVRLFPDVSSVQVTQALGDRLSKTDFIMIASEVLMSSRADNVGYSIQCDNTQCSLELFPFSQDATQNANDLRRMVFNALSEIGE